MITCHFVQLRPNGRASPPYHHQQKMKGPEPTLLKVP